MYMQVSGGHLLPPVQKLVATSIFLFPLGKEKSKSSPVARPLNTRTKSVFLFL